MGLEGLGLRFGAYKAFKPDSGFGVAVGDAQGRRGKVGAPASIVLRGVRVCRGWFQQGVLWGLAGSSGRAAAGRSDNNCLASHTGTPEVAVTSRSRPSIACPWFG